MVTTLTIQISIYSECYKFLNILKFDSNFSFKNEKVKILSLKILFSSLQRLTKSPNFVLEVGTRVFRSLNNFSVKFKFPLTITPLTVFKPRTYLKWDAKISYFGIFEVA